jgi:hypothetical protein
VLDSSDRGTPTISLAPPRQQFSKESAWLIALVVVGTALKIPLRIWFGPLFRPAFSHAFSWVSCQIALMCAVPFALRLNWELGLAGAPFIGARLARQKPPGRLRSLIGTAFVYDLASIVVSFLAIALLVFSGVLRLPVSARGASHASAHSLRSLPFAAFQEQAGRFAVTGILAAIGAGLSEEIMFRLSAFAIFIWLFRFLLREGAGRPSRTALWCATTMQGYAFGLLHLILRPAVLPKLTTPILISGLAAPQTWVGIVLGRLYLRRGLEATMIAHTMFDVGWFLLMAAIMYLTQILTVLHSEASLRILTAGHC